MRTCGRQTSIEWRLWSSGKPAHNDDGLSMKPWLSTLEPFLKSWSFNPSRLSALLEDDGGNGGGRGEDVEDGSRKYSVV